MRTSDIFSHCRLRSISLANNVRFAIYPNEPMVLQSYLEAAFDASCTLVINKDKQRLWLDVTRLMLEAVCDDCNPKHWRQLCLDNIYQPMFMLEKVSIDSPSKKKAALIRMEIMSCGRFFL